MHGRLILKIVSREEWADATEAGLFRGAEIDLIDGYIHFPHEIRSLKLQPNISPVAMIYCWSPSVKKN